MARHGGSSYRSIKTGAVNRILVTGAAGFAGSVIAAELTDRGHNVTRTRRPRPGVSAASGGESSTWVDIDLADEASFAELPQTFDVVVHAAVTLPHPGVTTDKMIADNIIATRNLINFARDSQVQKFIYLSSVSVHGTIISARVDEHTPIMNPEPYGYTKRAGELLLAEPAAALPSISLRLPGIVGSGANTNWLTAAAATLAAGRDLNIRNPDAPFNNAVHVHDLAAYCAHLVDAALDGHTAIPLGSEGMMTIQDIAGVLKARLGGGTINVVSDEKSPFTIDDSLARRSFGYVSMTIAEVVTKVADAALAYWKTIP